jgi:AAA15 family ATPase/GTPase
MNAEIFLNGQEADICNFISAGCEMSERNIEKWWSKTALTEAEIFVTKALNIIEPKVERISQIKDDTSTSRFLIRLSDQKKPVPLRSMGDGINRILTIILAMVNCENGYLLIDEFENGLHYSVQEKLWKIIFHLAERLNIQVFVTTHSNDTIRAFENIVNQNEIIPLDGLLIKLENIDDTIEATTFEPSELKVITDNLIEVRR